MTAPKCTEQDFIDAFRELQSTGKVAERFGYSGCSMVTARRRSIEKRLGIVLPQFDTRPAYNRTEVDHSNAVVKLTVPDGVVLIGSDIHVWPGPRTTMQRAFVHFARLLRPDVIILNGDVFDGAGVSRHPPIGWEHRPTVQQELEAVGDLLGDLVKAVGKARRIWNAGNHDSRFSSRIASQIPELSGVKGTRLKDHFPLWEPAWRTDINEDVVVKHRAHGGEHSDYNNVLKSGKTIITGHDHRAGVTPYHDYHGVRWGVRCGYMGESPLDHQFVHYLEAREDVNWVPAFVVLTFVGGRLLWPELVTKHDDDIVNFRGKIITV